MAKIPRGYRNHNPLNLRITKDPWQGLAKQQTDKAFFQFVSNAYGYRAAFKTLHTYMTRYHRMCVQDIISAWAPATENNTHAYINRVCELSKIPRLCILNINNKVDMCALVSAMATVENGIPPVQEEIQEGYFLAFGF